MNRMMAAALLVPVALAVPGPAVGVPHTRVATVECVPADAFGRWLVPAANAGGVNDPGDNFGAAAAVGDFNGDRPVRRGVGPDRGCWCGMTHR